MAVPHALWILSLVVAVGVAAGVGYGLGAASIPVAPPPRAADNSEVVSAMREVMARIDRLENAFVNRPAATERHQAPRATEAPAPVDDRIDAAIEKLTAFAERISIAQGSGADETLRLARAQRPEPDLAALLPFHQAMLDEQEQENPEPHRSVQRPWIMRTAAEVVQAFGAPTRMEAFSGLYDMHWTYVLPDDAVVEFFFRSGLVFLVSI